MTKGGTGKSKTLGRLIFGEKRKQHASPSRQRSATRNGGSATDLTSPGGGGGRGVVNKSPINIHDWAVWRMQLNEQMGSGVAGRGELKQMRQYLQSNPFYQQHSRDPSNGRYTGVRLLFSIPHTKLKSELTDGSKGGINKNNNIEVGDASTYDQSTAQPNSDDRTTTSVNSVSAGPSMIIDKTISQVLPKALLGHTADFLHTNEQIVAADGARSRRAARNSYTAADRVHSTLQKAVKDGNVLEKIKAFEMQAAAAQAESAAKASGIGGGISTRMQSVTSSIQSTTHRTLSPTTLHPIQHPISPIPMQHRQQQQQQQQQYVRSHRSRHVHPVQNHRDGNHGSIVGHESRKGAHVLEPAHGDIILKRRTPSQRTANDEDYSIAAISSMTLTAPQGHPRQHHYHHRTSASRSRHRQELVHDKRTPNHIENVYSKHQQKQRGTSTTPTPSAAAKTSTRRHWLRGRKETPTEITTKAIKQEIPTTKSSKHSKSKKKNVEQEKVESTKKTKTPVPKEKPSSDNNRVYGVPTTTVNEQTKYESTALQSPARIEEENESDREQETTENKNTYTSTKAEDTIQIKECNKILATTVERRPSRKQQHQKLSSTDGEILSRVEDDTRFSRPTDDHAHRSELIDEDDECKSEGDVFIEEPSVKSATNINPYQQQPSNTIRRRSSQCSADELPSDRRWQWSKESGGLIDKGNRKKKQQQPITVVTHKNKINEEEEQIVYETPKSEQIQAPVGNTHTLKKKRSFHTTNTNGNDINTSEQNNTKQISKQILHTIMNSVNNTKEQSATGPLVTDEFFENGPHTNPEESMTNMTTSA